ncbi:hypothetical protein [Gordonia sp. UCD-TK1]|uniref:hypothetical protein n=1 Tax=Gordonia sp. UCD-TK1 TaxID=1857893 RepID=UPI00080EBADA|nr:hypothetical protein [Gordonia sp. UCD-TK1]OCH80979.1 hypothetical protein A9310_19640 [Gordonia sp. UCD-TK1]
MTNQIIKTYDASTGQTLVRIEDLMVAQTAATALASQVRELKLELAETERERARIVDLERTTAHQLERVTAQRDQLRSFIQSVVSVVGSTGRQFADTITASARSLGINTEGLW